MLPVQSEESGTDGIMDQKRQDREACVGVGASLDDPSGGCGGGRSGSVVSVSTRSVYKIRKYADARKMIDGCKCNVL